MDIHLRTSEISAIQRLLLAEPDTDALLDDQTLLALTQLVPCDTISIAEVDVNGRRLRGNEIPPGAHLDLDAQPRRGPWTAGQTPRATSPANHSAGLFRRRIGATDNVWIGFSTDGGTVVQLHLERRTTYFTPRDLTIIAMLEPALGRLLRSRPKTASLTPTERRILELVANGATNREAADELCISVATVRKHLEHAYRKLGVHNRTGALAAIT